MAISSSLLARRSVSRRSTATQQLIVFRIQQERFALPIQLAQKVIPLGEVYGGSQETDLQLTRYQNQDLLVINVERRVFSEVSSQKALPSARLRTFAHLTDSLEHQRYLLIVQTSQGESMGLPLNTQPSLMRVPASAFAPIPPSYRTEGRIRCISALVTAESNTTPIFLLNPDQLLRHCSIQG